MSKESLSPHSPELQVALGQAGLSTYDAVNPNLLAQRLREQSRRLYTEVRGWMSPDNLKRRNVQILDTNGEIRGFGGILAPSEADLRSIRKTALASLFRNQDLPVGLFVYKQQVDKPGMPINTILCRLGLVNRSFAEGLVDPETSILSVIDPEGNFLGSKVNLNASVLQILRNHNRQAGVLRVAFTSLRDQWLIRPDSLK